MEIRTKTKILILAAILSACFAGCSTSQPAMPTVPLSTISKGLDTPWDDRLIFQTGLIPAEQGAAGRIGTRQCISYKPRNIR